MNMHDLRKLQKLRAGVWRLAAARVRSVLVALVLLSGAAPALAEDFVLVHERGQIVSVNYADNSAMIGGLKFRFALDARVEIAGSFGAFTMLLKDMKVDFVYRRYSETDREVVMLRQLPDDMNIPNN